MDIMSLYLHLKIQEQFFYISVVAEIANIIYFVTRIMEIELLYGFHFAKTVFNVVYLFYMLYILFNIGGKFKISSIAILSLSLSRHFFYVNNYLLSIIDSVICLIVLIFSHYFLYLIMEEIEFAIFEELEGSIDDEDD